MRRRLVLALLAGLSAAPTAADEVEFSAERTGMIRVIVVSTLLSSPETGIREIEPRVLAAMAKVPRHRFVPEPLLPFAYRNGPLPVGFDQNLSQPFIAALMTHLLAPKEGDVVYETGTDTGYQAALLHELGARVFSVEIIEPLAAAAAVRLKTLGYGRVTVKAGDGYDGWPEHAPYDGILVKEALDHLPPALVAQLKPGGRMVLPLGPSEDVQHLTLVEKGADGTLRTTRVLPVRFSPFQGGKRI
ncbi:MAG: protein-L-isoaspartate O-methyltransferase [Proteobacteria bacterium]|nr:protein-L-isoaspartate O-methyltransferase [Pseudomonadota bacterium]